MGESNSKVAVAHLWHFYQPPWQTDYWVKRIAEECYLPVSEWLAKNPDFKVGVNINNSLVQHFQRLGLGKVIDNLGSAADSGAVEFTGSSAYHALLSSLLSHEGGREEVRRQIELNERGNQKAFGSSWKPKGFFPPELAFSEELAEEILNAGYLYSLADSASFDSANPGKAIPHKDVGVVRGLPVFFRSGWSNEFSMARPSRKEYDLSRYARDLGNAARAWFNGDGGHIDIGYDVETIGHHIIPYRERLDEYRDSLVKEGIVPAHFSEILESFPTRTDVKILPASWSTSGEQALSGNYFPLWTAPGNPVHAVLKDLTGKAIGAVHKAGREAGNLTEYSDARDALDQGLQSCKEWWANPPGLYNKDNVRSGADFLFKAIGKSGDALEGAGKANKYGEESAELSRKLEQALVQFG